MVRSRLLLVVPVLLGGCTPLQVLDPNAGAETPMVATGPFGGGQPLKVEPVKVSYAPGSTDLAVQVDVVRRKVLAANPALAIQPRAGLIGAPDAEVFHQGTQIIWLTEGLVKRCKSEGELAAVLCLELGKMVAQREALAGSKSRSTEERLPLGVPIGNVGLSATPDQTPLAELAKYENQRKQAAQQRQQPLDPQALAGRYLEKAGYDRGLLEGVGPLLADAEKNCLYEKQFKGSLGGPGWVPVGPEP